MSSESTNSIRVVLDLVAQSSGMGALTSMSYALSSLLGSMATGTGSADALNNALLRQETANLRLTRAQDLFGEAMAATGTKGTALTQALAEQEGAALRLRLAEEDLAASQEVLAGLNESGVVGVQQMVWEEAREAEATNELNLGLAQQQMALADAKVADAELAVQREQDMLTAKAATAEYNLQLAQQQAQTADLAVTQAELNAQEGNGAQVLGQYMAVLLAAAGEALAFDSALRAVVQDSADLQFTSVQMDLALHGTQAQIDALNPKIIQWADNSLYTTQQVHQLVQALSEKGLDITSILNGDGESAIKLGEAINADPVAAANLLGSTLQEFSSQGLTAADAADTLTAAYYNGIPSASDLQTALADVGGQAATMGITLTDLVSTLDLLAQSGMQAGSAGASLRYMLQNIADPTAKAATDMNFLGLTVVNTTSPAFKQLTSDLNAAGATGQAAVTAFDGTSVGLNNMFKAAQTLHLIPLNESFNAWATASGAMSSKFFDAQGHFLGLQNAMTQLVQAVQDKAKGNPQLAATLLDDMFNVRSGRAAQLLTNAKDFKDHYNRIVAEIGKTSVSTDATQLLDTLSGAWKEFQTTLKSTGATIGNAVNGPLMAIVQTLNGFVGNLMANHAQLLLFLGVFIGVGAVLGTLTAIIVGVIAVFVVLVGIVGGPVVLAFAIVAAAIPVAAAIIAGVVLFIRAHLAQIQAFLAPFGAFFNTLWKTIRQAWSETAADFAQVTPTFFGTFSTMGAALGQLWQAFQPLLPVVKSVAIAIGGILVVGLGLGIAAIVGIVQAVSFLLQGLAQIITGVVQIFVGLLAFFTNIGVLITDFFTYIFTGMPQAKANEMERIMGQLGDNLHMIWSGIENVAVGVFNATLGAIVALIMGFVDSAIHFFTDLYDKLVGHSIIPDMVRAIWDWFEQLPGRALQAIQGLVSQVKSLFAGLASDMLGYGRNLLSMLAQGIRNGIGDVIGAATQVAGNVRNILGFHSPPAEGPLADSDQYMPNMLRMFAGGITGNQHLVTGALTGLAGQMALVPGLTAPLAGVPGAQGGGNSIANFNVDGHTLYQIMMNRLTGEMRMNNLGTQWR
jgi:hypothetical protein